MFFSLNTCKFGDFVDLIELEIKYTTYTARSASYLDLHSESDNEDRIRTKLYDIRDDFNFPNVNIFYLYAATFQQHPNIDYTMYISHLTRYSRACSSYHDLIADCLLLMRKLLDHGFLVVKLQSSLRMVHGRHRDLVTEYLCHKWPRISSICRIHYPVLSSFMSYHGYHMWITNCLPFRSTWVNPRLIVGFVFIDSLVFCVMFCRSLFVLLSFFFVIVLSVLLWYTASDYPFCIFKVSFFPHKIDVRFVFIPICFICYMYWFTFSGVHHNFLARC